MPVIGVPVKELNLLVGKNIEPDQMVSILKQLGCDVEGFARLHRFSCQRCQNIIETTETEENPCICDLCGADFKNGAELISLDPVEVIRMELLAVRPDMFDVGGLARALRGYLGFETGLPNYQVSPPKLKLQVDPAMSSPDCFRPYIACAVVRGVKLNDFFIRALMKLQENLHWAMGRNRKLASIGVYDLDILQGDIYYRPVAPDGVAFVPLGAAGTEEGGGLAVTPKQILLEHPKGKAFSYLLEKHNYYPLLLDSRGTVLSMPPIINSHQTRVTAETTNFFVDVTGTVEKVVNKTLNTFICSLKEMEPGMEIEQVEIISGLSGQEKQINTPDFKPDTISLSSTDTNQLLGLDLDVDTMVSLLEKMRHQAIVDGEHIQVQIPSFRSDILHPQDLIEDVAIAYGYHNLVPELLDTMTVGQASNDQEVAFLARDILCGLGFFEIISLMLTCPEKSFDALGLPRTENYVKIENPISWEQSMVRNSLVPGLLDLFAHNRENDLPQHLFEVGEVAELMEVEGQQISHEYFKVAAGILSSRASYAEIRSRVEAFLREFGLTIEVEPLNHPLFIPGRGAAIKLVETVDGKRELHTWGFMGEVHPQVLEIFNLTHPLSLFEVNLPN